MSAPVQTQPQGYAYTANVEVIQPVLHGPPGPGYAPVPQRDPQAGGVAMPAPGGMPGVPPGLEYLAQVDQLLVHQQMEILEMLSGWETKNKYVVKNAVGQQVYFAAEESGDCMRLCCGARRGFVMHILDNFAREVIRVKRDFKFCARLNCCAFSDCCAMELVIEAPVGEVVGRIRQSCSFIMSKYDVLDANSEVVLTISSPCCICDGCPCDQNFLVYSKSTGEKVGKISKQWAGFGKEIMTDADNFGISFPADLDVRVKAALLGAVFLIDFMFFEKDQKSNSGTHHH